MKTRMYIDSRRKLRMRNFFQGEAAENVKMKNENLHYVIPEERFKIYGLLILWFPKTQKIKNQRMPLQLHA